MISNNFIPEKIADFNVYLDGKVLIGVASSVTLPQVQMMRTSVEGAGIGGTLDSPVLGQFESMAQEIQFNALYSDIQELLHPMKNIKLTFRAAQQALDKSEGYALKGMRVVETGRVKSFNPGRIQKGASMEATVQLELTAILIENDGAPLVEVDKLNGVYKVRGEDMLAELRTLV